MRQKLTVLVLLVTFSVLFNCDSSTDPEDNQNLKEEALEFSLDVIETFLEQDTATYQSYLRDTLYISESWEEPVLTSTIPDSVSLPRGNFSGYTMEDFHDNYETTIYSYSELMEIEDFKQWIEE